MSIKYRHGSMQRWVLCDMFYMRGVENVDVIVDRSSGAVREARH
jgi:hypothetical protein